MIELLTYQSTLVHISKGQISAQLGEESKVEQGGTSGYGSKKWGRICSNDKKKRGRRTLYFFYRFLML
jgi:hypothetical protein